MTSNKETADSQVAKAKATPVNSVKLKQPKIKPEKKPTLRGYFHQEAFFVALGACVLLVAKSSSRAALISSLVYSFGLLFLFGVSAVYHRPHWEPKPRALMKRFDHSAIFILIAASFTPFCLIALTQEHGEKLLWTVWIAAFVGVLQSIFWIKAPKWITSPYYVFVGWLVYPYLGEIRDARGTHNMILVLIGGLFYTLGAVFYAFKWPKPGAKHFGYHELFHALTIIAAAFHFAVIYQMIH